MEFLPQFFAQDKRKTNSITRCILNHFKFYESRSSFNHVFYIEHQIVDYDLSQNNLDQYAIIKWIPSTDCKISGET
jgi:hypothetical protein